MVDKPTTNDSELRAIAPRCYQLIYNAATAIDTSDNEADNLQSEIDAICHRLELASEKDDNDYDLKTSIEAILHTYSVRSKMGHIQLGEMTNELFELIYEHAIRLAKRKNAEFKANEYEKLAEKTGQSIRWINDDHYKLSDRLISIRTILTINGCGLWLGWAVLLSLLIAILVKVSK
jgi:hypothetical protein